MECRFLSDEISEICCCDASPYCADFCPVTEHPEICRHCQAAASKSEE